MSQARKTELAPIIAAQEKVKSVEVLQSFKLGTWHIIYIANGVSDEPYLFYSGSPTTSKRLGAWSGAATIFETEEIQQWVVKNIPGVPLELASCFAWHVTLNRDQ